MGEFSSARPGAVRRYGPSMVAPQVAPRPELGRGPEMAFQAFEQSFAKINEFLRPAVTQVQTVKGEQEALAEVERSGPEFALQRTTPQGEIVTGGGQGAAPASDGSAGRPGPTRERARAAAFGQPMPGSGGSGRFPRGAPASLIQTESGGNWSASNTAVGAGGHVGHVGRLQFGRARLDDAIAAGIIPKGTSFETFKANPGMQTRVEAWHFGDIADFVEKNDLDRYVGTTINGIEVTPGGMIAVAHLGGNGGLQKFLETGGAYNPEDDNGTSLSDYLAIHGGQAVVPTDNGLADYQLAVLNESSFEPRLPFTVRDAAFNASADRMISARAAAAMEDAIAAASAKANGDLGVLRSELEKAKSKIMANLPAELPGLQTALEEQFARSKSVAERNTIDLAQRRVVAQQGEAAAGAAATIKAEAERIALTGGTPQELAAAMASGQANLVAFGPREGFVLNGQVYGPDPTRAGILSQSDMADALDGIQIGAQKLMLESEFQRSGAPGAFVEEFRNVVFSGNSPFPAAEALGMLSDFEGRVRSNESRRMAAAEAERDRLKEETETTINAYVSMTEAGVPVAIPQSERTRILAALAPYPELQREAEIEFAVADAAVATHGMSAGQVAAYTEKVRGDMAAAAERGELDLEGAAVVASLQDKMKALGQAVTAEMIGLPVADQLAMSGATYDPAIYEGMRLQAEGKPELMAQIDAAEEFHKGVQDMKGLSAADRDAVLQKTREGIAALGRMAVQLGEPAGRTLKVLDRLEQWSGKRKELARTDSVAFAASVGVALAPFNPEGGLVDAGQVIAGRVKAIKPFSAQEGVTAPVPISAPEAAALTEAFRASPRADQAGFLAAIAGLGRDQAKAIFSAVGQSDPAIMAAGITYAGGNRDAANLILRGIGDAKIDGVDQTNIVVAQEAALSELLTLDVIPTDQLPLLQAAAVAYARGKALSEGGRAADASDIEEGYMVALGRQPDGTGGPQDTALGMVLAPAGWDADRIDASVKFAVRDTTPEALAKLAGGQVESGDGFVYDPETLWATMEGMLPTDDEFVFRPVDQNGAFFLVRQPDGQMAPLLLDLRKM